MCQRTENRARKMHVFASVCSQVMKGRGGDGMLTFLVLLHLLPLQYMLLRCTDVWQCCFAVYMKGWGGVWLHVTFLVLLPLHVATLPNVIQKWPEKQRLCMSG